MLIVLIEQPTNTLSTSLVQFHTAFSQVAHDNALSSTPLQTRDHPDRDFYRDSSLANDLTYLMVLFAVGITIVVLLLSGLSNKKLVELLIPSPILPSYLPCYIILAISEFIMLYMLLDDMSCVQLNRSRRVIHWIHELIIGGWWRFCLFVLLVGGAGLNVVQNSLHPSYYLGAGAATYCVLSFWSYFVGKLFQTTPNAT